MGNRELCETLLLISASQNTAFRNFWYKATISSPIISFPVGSRKKAGRNHVAGAQHRADVKR